MSWHVIARKNVHDAGRSRTVRLLAGLLFVAFCGYAVGHTYVGPDRFLPFLQGLATLVGSLLPLLAILLGYKSIVTERESGSLLLTLSLPHSRRDVVAGTFAGRAALLLVPTLFALVLAGAIGVVRYGTDGAVLYPWFLLATVLYGVAFLGIAIGLSMTTTADRWITLGAVGGYLLLVQAWDNFHTVTLLFLHRFDFGVLIDMPDWALFFRLVKPSESYYRLLRAGFDVDLAGRYVADGVPAYVDWWAAAALLVAWCLVPLALGFRRFGTADL